MSATLSIPRLLISGVGAGVGKSIFTIGLILELKRRGISLGLAVVGPQIITSSVHRRVSNRFVHTLDSNLLTPEQLFRGAILASSGADMLLIDGSKGLFDGVKGGSTGSDSELAALLNIPTALLIDSVGLGASFAAILKGFSSTAKSFDVVGAVLNRVLGDARAARDLYEHAVSTYETRPLFGALPEVPRLTEEIPFRLGGELTQASGSLSVSRQVLLDIARAVADHVDIDALVICAGDADPISHPLAVSPPSTRLARIGVADDSCFGVCFQDNLDYLRYFGAEIVPFSPLADGGLPKKLGALYFPGGLISQYAREIAGNDSLKAEIRAFADSGGVIYSEGAGTVYLGESFQIEDRGVSYEGVGVYNAKFLPGRAGFSYVSAATIEESILGTTGVTMKGITLDDFRISAADRLDRLLRVQRGAQSAVTDGLSPSPQIFGSLGFYHFGSNIEIPRTIVEAAQVVKGFAKDL